MCRANTLVVAVVAMALMVFLGGVAYAGFVPDTVVVRFATPPPGGNPPPWAGPPVWATTPPDAAFEHASGLLSLTESFKGPDSLPLSISGQTEGDPVMTITKAIENDSGVTWLGFLVSLPEQGGIKFDGTPTSDKMELLSASDYQLVFTEPAPVAQGETMTLSFDVLIPSTGPFVFTLTQEPSIAPIPEPTTLALFMLGALSLLLWARRKR